MKSPLIKAILFTTFFSFLHVSFSFSQSQNILSEGYYVVVAAYAPSKENFAQRYTSKLNGMGKEASYGFSPLKKLFFVYLFFDRNFRTSLNEMKKTRQEEQFYDAWVYVMGDYKAPIDIEAAQIQSVKEKKVEETQKISKADIRADSSLMASTKTVIEDQAKQELHNKVVFQEQQQFENKKPEELILSDFLVMFNLYNSSSLEDVSGEVQVIDAIRASLLDVLPGGNYHVLPDPNNRSRDMLLIADLFGYRKIQRSINFYKPLKDSLDPDINVIADIFVVDFPLVRYHVGDIATMFHVYFFKDAAMMLPESTYELEQLLSMMKENPNYKIKIHGHTNGRSAGKIITMGEDKNLFALTDDDVEGFGSAQKLSEERANVIKQYLMDNGITEDRMEVKAWGGRRMLYDKHSNQAKLNVRVEIEILAE